jgi:hypothetical protein
MLVLPSMPLHFYFRDTVGRRRALLVVNNSAMLMRV